MSRTSCDERSLLVSYFCWVVISGKNLSWTVKLSSDLFIICKSPFSIYTSAGSNMSPSAGKSIWSPFDFHRNNSSTVTTLSSSRGMGYPGILPACPGNEGWKKAGKKYILDGPPYFHTFTVASPPTSVFLWGGKKPDNPDETLLKRTCKISVQRVTWAQEQSKTLELWGATLPTFCPIRFLCFSWKCQLLLLNLCWIALTECTTYSTDLKDLSNIT